MSSVLHALVEPGFFSSEATAAVIGAMVAIVAAGVGVFTVIRGQAFAGEALGDIGAAGGSSAYLIPIPAVWGFLAITAAAAGAMELIGIQRARGRDLATGIVLGLGFGLTSLFLYFGTTTSSTTGAPVTILFGSLSEISSSNLLPIVLALGGVTLAILGALYRPLLLVSVSAELAAARAVPVRLIGAAYLVALAVAVALADLTIGAILSTALIVGPAAAALRLTNRPAHAALAAAAISVGCVWLGLLLAWDSYYWPHHGWPVSFFVVTLVLLVYLLSGVAARLAARRRRG